MSIGSICQLANICFVRQLCRKVCFPFLALWWCYASNLIAFWHLADTFIIFLLIFLLFFWVELFAINTINQLSKLIEHLLRDFHWKSMNFMYSIALHDWILLIVLPIQMGIEVIAHQHTHTHTYTLFDWTNTGFRDHSTKKSFCML